MARSLKHTRNFKYKRHNKVFDGFGDNLRDMGNFVRKLKAKHGHVELRSPKHFSVAQRGPHPERQCYSLTWYTRKDMGPKSA